MAVAFSHAVWVHQAFLRREKRRRFKEKPFKSDTISQFIMVEMLAVPRRSNQTIPLVPFEL